MLFQWILLFLGTQHIWQHNPTLHTVTFFSSSFFRFKKENSLLSGYLHDMVPGRMYIFFLKKYIFQR